MLSLVALPYIEFVLTRLVHGLLLARYGMPAIIGVVLGLACALSFAGRRAVVIFAAFCALHHGRTGDEFLGDTRNLLHTSHIFRLRQGSNSV